MTARRRLIVALCLAAPFVPRWLGDKFVSLALWVAKT